MKRPDQSGLFEIPPPINNIFIYIICYNTKKTGVLMDFKILIFLMILMFFTQILSKKVKNKKYKPLLLKNSRLYVITVLNCICYFSFN